MLSANSDFESLMLETFFKTIQSSKPILCGNHNDCTCCGLERTSCYVSKNKVHGPYGIVFAYGDPFNIAIAKALHGNVCKGQRNDFKKKRQSGPKSESAFDSSVPGPYTVSISQSARLSIVMFT